MRARTGFTLVEMLVVIVIVVILASILFPAVTSMRKKSEAQKTKSTPMKPDAAIRPYATAMGHYPYFAYDEPWVNGSTTWPDHPLKNSKMLYQVLESQYVKGAIADTATDSGDVYYIDYWKKPFIYVYKSPSPTPARHPDAPEAEDGYEREFELWSAGPDMKFTNLRGGTGDKDNVTATEWQKP